MLMNTLAPRISYLIRMKSMKWRVFYSLWVLVNKSFIKRWHTKLFQLQSVINNMCKWLC